MGCFYFCSIDRLNLLLCSWKEDQTLVFLFKHFQIVIHKLHTSINEDIFWRQVEKHDKKAADHESYQNLWHVHQIISHEKVLETIRKSELTFKILILTLWNNFDFHVFYIQLFIVNALLLLNFINSFLLKMNLNKYFL